MLNPASTHDAGWTWAGRGVVALAAVVAVLGARPYAGGWHDGSRFAAVESLAERGTFVIDESIFVRVPPADRPQPYPADRPDLIEHGTRDKLFIDGRYYSDKSPVPTVLMAGLYRAWLAAGGPTASERPDLFCWWLTVLTAGLPYVFAVWCMGRLVGGLGLPGQWSFLLTLSFALATVAPAYTRHVNPHVLFLAAAAGLCLNLAKLPEGPTWRGALVGTCAGFGYTLDLGLGPPMLVVLLPVVAWMTRRVVPVLVVALAAAPWLIAHHALNYTVGGTLIPANAVPEYLQWPGSPFDARTATGGLKHSAVGFVLYAADLLVGKKGFLFHNLPLLLTPAGTVMLWLWRPQLRPVVTFAAGWPVLGWLLYAATSTNLSGEACSIRWFVPFLAPGVWLVGLVVREFPRYRPDLAWLTAVGLVMGTVMWLDGPWARKMVPGYWAFPAVALVGCGVIRARDWRRASPQVPAPVPVTTRSSSAA